MTRHEFIFSNQRRPRIARHLTFWTVWSFSYLLLFHIPFMTFKGWGFNREADPLTFKNLEQIGPVLLIIKILIFNTLLATVLPQAIFTYILINRILPAYFYKKKKPLVTAAVLIGLLLSYDIVFSLFRHFVGIGNYIFGVGSLHTWEDIVKFGSRAALRDDFSSLPIVVSLAVMIKLIKRWWLKQKEAEQLSKEKAKAELQLLKAQVHPHFLFNTLNNIYFFTLTNSSMAPEMIKKLSAMLHYILNECKQPMVSLEKEINMVRDYMALEKIRYGEQMQMEIEIKDNYDGKLISPLLLIPFIENSFKHGTSKMLTNPYVKLRITIENNMLSFFITNSRPPISELMQRNGNIGLKNVRKRLQLLYPGTHELNIVELPESFTVFMKIQLTEVIVSSKSNEELKPITAHELA